MPLKKKKKKKFYFARQIGLCQTRFLPFAVLGWWYDEYAVYTS